MCGIYGFIGKPTKKTGTILRRLAILNEERGTDSSGVAIVNDRYYTLLKNAVKSSVLWSEANPGKYIGNGNNCQFCMVIGHTRQATHGKVTSENAHPFKNKNIIYAHNGMIYNFESLQRQQKTKFKVDSQIIGSLLNTYPEHKAFKKLNAWFSVPYINLKKPRQLNIARHTSPLSFAIRTDKQGIYYSSLATHLKQALKGLYLRASIGYSGNDKLYRFSWVKDQVRITKEKLSIKEYVYYQETSEIEGGYYPSYNWEQLKEANGVKAYQKRIDKYSWSNNRSKYYEYSR